MSGLKPIKIMMAQPDAVGTVHKTPCDVYLKGEADKVIAEKDKEIAELKRQVAFLKTTHDSCGHCNNCAEGMGKVFDENLDELKMKLAEKDKEIAALKAG